jgi:hypothetical protein
MVRSAGPTEATNNCPIEASVSSANTMIGPDPGGTIGPKVPPAAQQPVASAGE